MGSWIIGKRLIPFSLSIILRRLAEESSHMRSLLSFATAREMRDYSLEQLER